MMKDLRRQLTEFRGQVEARGQTEQRCNDARDSLVEAQYRLRAFELQLEQARSELSKLEGFSLESLLYGLLGSKGQRVEAAGRALEELSQQHDTCSRTLAELGNEVARLERQVVESSNAGDAHESLLATKREQIEHGDEAGAARLCEFGELIAAAEGVVEGVGKAMAAGREASRDLRSELDVLATLGRCRVAEGCRGITALMNAGRGHTADQSAERVRKSVGRFRRKLGDAIAEGGADVGVREMEQQLGRISKELSAAWLAPSAPDSASSEYLQDMLQSADTLLEKMLAEARDRVAAIEDQRRAFIEGA